MKTRVSVFAFLIISIILVACGGRRKEDALMTNVTGKLGEIVIVIEKKYWQDSIGGYFETTLAEEHPALPQREPMFNLVNIPHKAFTDIFKTHRNVIFIHINPSIEEPKIVFKKNVWSKPQLFIEMYASSKNTFLPLLNENIEKIAYFFRKGERERLQGSYKKFEEQSIRTYLEANHDILLYAPSGYKLEETAINDTFVWIAHETPEISQGLLVYHYNFVDTNTFTLDYLLDKRDEFLKHNVPGPTQGSYMTTDREFPIVFEELKHKGKYATLIQGLWRVEGDFMGGPFVSLSTVDEKRNRVVTLEGYVYAPGKKKRNYFWQVEAIVRSFEIKE